jgi:ATP-dependent protease HslVU (ClpYQ) peptidase subunit
MTCIVGLEQDGVVYIGGDAAGTDTNYNVVCRQDEKVFLSSGGKMIMGFTTSFRMGQLLRYSFEPPKKSKNKTDMEYLVTDVMDSIRKVFSNKGFMKEKNPDCGGTFLLGYRKKLYTIESDFQVEASYNNYSACGSGYGYALGSMFSTPSMSPMERIKLALEAATHHNAAVRPPYTILSLGKAKK